MFILDQSFSEENLRRIYDTEKRKWFNIEEKYIKYYRIVLFISNRIKKKIKEKSEVLILYKKAPLNSVLSISLKQQLEDIENNIQYYKDKKDIVLSKIFNRVSANINQKSFTIDIRKVFNTKTKKNVYITNNHETFFVVKQLQYNINRLYKVKQSDRWAIVNSIKCILDDKLPKIVLKIDIKKFYENINFELLLEKIKDDALLNHVSVKMISEIYKVYRNLSGDIMWIPRWIWISWYLAELFMKEFDEKIKNTVWIYYYARYVDDIVIVWTSSFTKEHYINLTVELLKKIWLELNNKTEFILYPSPWIQTINYLGYKFFFKNELLNIELSDKKMFRYKKKLDLAFQNYINNNSHEKKAKSLILKRIRYLTSNIRLLWKKSWIRAWIRSSNSLLKDSSVSLKELDDYLQDKIMLYTTGKLAIRLSKFKFQEWFSKNLKYLFKNKRIYKDHNGKNLEPKEDQFYKVTKIWNNV